MSISDNLKQIRKQKGHTQGALAELAKVELTQISRIERGASEPKLETIKNLAIALGCSTDDLIMDGDKKQPYYIKKTIEKVQELTPLRQFVLLDIIDSYCKQWEIREPILNSWNDKGLSEFDIHRMELDAFRDQVVKDDDALDEIKHEIRIVRENERI